MDKSLDDNNKLISAALQTILNSTSDMVFIKDLKLVYRGASYPFAKLVGMNNPMDIIGKTDIEIFKDLELAKRYTQDDRRILDNRISLRDYIEPIPSKDGRPSYTSTSKEVITDEDGNVIGLCGISRDITRDYEARLNYERELQYLFELPPDAVAAALFDITNWRVVDFRTRVDDKNVVSNYATIDEFITNAANSIVVGDEALEFFKSFSRDYIYEVYDSGKRSMDVEYLRYVPGGQELWVKNELHFLADPTNAHLFVLIILFDINSVKRKHEEIERAAENDAMTGLLNRDTTMKQIESFLHKESPRGTHALFLVDIDNFKLINDTFGHQSGDRVLTETASLIKSVSRESDIVGRIGGDEFFILFKNMDQKWMVHDKAQKLVYILQHVCATAAGRVELSASIGISIFNGDGKSLKQMYAEADIALYKAKDQGKNRFHIYHNGDEGSHKSLFNQENGIIGTVNLHALLNKIDAGIVIYHANSSKEMAMPIFISESLLNMLGGLTEQEGLAIYQNGLFEALHPDERERFSIEYQSALHNDKTLRTTCRIRGKDDCYYWVAISANITVNNDNSIDIYALYTSMLII